MINEFGEKLDSNGYAKSIITNEDCCFCCGNTTIARHELFRSALRQKSKAYGLWVPLCPLHHQMVHSNREMELDLKKRGEIEALKRYDWTIEEFIKNFGRNYLC